MRVIVTADDFGINKYRTIGIAEAFKSGAISSSVFLVNGEDPVGAVEIAKSCGLIKNLGLHMNVTEGEPCAPKDRIPSLLDAQGNFLGKVGFMDAAEAGCISMAEVEIEILAQIDRFHVLTGFFPVHADGHHHAHVFPGLAPAFAKALAAKGVKSTRIPLDQAFLAHPDDISNVQSDNKWMGGPFYHFVCMAAKSARAIYAEAGVISSNMFSGLCLMGKWASVERYEALAASRFRRLDDGATGVERAQNEELTVEIMTHPGHAPVIVGANKYWYSSFECADRQHELDVLSHPSVRTALGALAWWE